MWIYGTWYDGPRLCECGIQLAGPEESFQNCRIEFGFHIIQLIEKRGDRVNTRHILLRPKVSEKN